MISISDRCCSGFGTEISAMLERFLSVVAAPAAFSGRGSAACCGDVGVLRRHKSFKHLTHFTQGRGEGGPPKPNSNWTDCCSDVCAASLVDGSAM